MTNQDVKNEDNVNHPKHYEGSTSIECIEAMVIAFGKTAVYHFCICNAFKYVWRHKHKNGKEDLEKARWYIDMSKKLGFVSDQIVALQELVNNKLNSWR